MENQHAKITGYRDLTQDEIDLMNEGKELAERCAALVTKLRTLEYDTVSGGSPAIIKTMADPRWVAIGVTQLQQGFMALTRSIAKPGTF